MSSLDVEIQEARAQAVHVTAESLRVDRIAYADSFALALVGRKSGTRASMDHKEFDPIAAEGNVKFLCLR